MWLLWLALLVPVAQIVATSHAISHANLEAPGDAGTKQTLHHTPCDLCFAAAALTNGAPAGTPYLLPHATAVRETPNPNFSRLWIALTVRVYESRAPPSLPH